MRPVVELKGRIIQVRAVEQGRDRRLRRHLHRVRGGAALRSWRVGYADGFLRSAGAAKGKPAPR